MRKIIYIFILAGTFISSSLFSQSITGEIISAFEAGNAEKLSAYFNNNLEMKILDDSHIVSKIQATRILQDFFKQHPPVSFKVTYESDKPDSWYGIATLTSKKLTFRVNLYFMDGGDKKLIYYLSIEKV